MIFKRSSRVTHHGRLSFGLLMFYYIFQISASCVKQINDFHAGFFIRGFNSIPTFLVDTECTTFSTQSRHNLFYQTLDAMTELIVFKITYFLQTVKILFNIYINYKYINNTIKCNYNN